METLNTVVTPQQAVNDLSEFVNRRPGMDFADYRDVRAYRSDARFTQQGRQIFEAVFSYGLRVYGEQYKAAILKELTECKDRLGYHDGTILSYIIGQYFPTEYRTHASIVAKNALRACYLDECKEKGIESDFRAFMGRNFSKAVINWFFN